MLRSCCLAARRVAAAAASSSPGATAATVCPQRRAAGTVAAFPSAGNPGLFLSLRHRGGLFMERLTLLGYSSFLPAASVLVLPNLLLRSRFPGLSPQQRATAMEEVVGYEEEEEEEKEEAMVVWTEERGASSSLLELATWNCSTLRKRRKKMNKHKWKKRRKLDRMKSKARRS